MQGTTVTCARSNLKPEHDSEAGHIRQKDPEGGVPRRAEAPRIVAARIAQRRRRAAAAGGGAHVWSWGTRSAAGAIAARGEMHGQDRVLRFLCEKKAG